MGPSEEEMEATPPMHAEKGRDLNPRPIRISITDETDISVARIAGAELAIDNGFDIAHRHCIMTTISELASNILCHAGFGTIEVQTIAGSQGDVGLEVVARDQGPGIENVPLALQCHLPRRGGHGRGLPEVHRLMTEMDVASRPGAGTMIRTVKWRSDRYLRSPFMPIVDAEETARRPLPLDSYVP